MKYFATKENKKVVHPDIPLYVTTLKEVRKNDWLQIYSELGFMSVKDYPPHPMSKKSDYLVDYKHKIDEDLKLQHWRMGEDHLIMPLRTKDSNPTGVDYRKHMIKKTDQALLTPTLEELLETIRGFYSVS